MNKIKILVIGLIILLASCEEYLDRPPQTEITVEAFYKTADDAIYAVNAAYQPLQLLWKRTMWYIGDLQSDDVLKGGGGPTDRTDATEIEFFTVFPDNIEGVEQCWTNAFRGIYYANVVLDKVPEIEMDKTFKNRILGEAKFLKAYYYFLLVRIFGDVPLFTKLIDVEEYQSITRTEQEKVYTQIIEDLIWASDNLPTNYSDNDIGRATKGAALTTLAKVYLTLKQYSECINICTEIEKLGYELEEDYRNLYNWQRNENGKESIFEVQYRYDPDFGGENTMISEYVAPRNQRILSNESYGFFVPSVEFFNLWEEDDQRFKVTLLTPGDSVELADGSYYFQDSNEIWEEHDKNINPTASNTRKYLNYEYERGQIGQERGSTNMYILRYSEVLLMHAEALNEINGGDNNAHEYLNKIRRRAYSDNNHDVSGYSQDELREAIFLERRKEFFMEQKRWFDIKRRGDAKAKEILHNTGKTNFDPDIHIYLPIPQSEIDINPKLIQNPGY